MTRPRIFETIAGLRADVEAARRSGRRIAMVPTMGALHEGHLSLVRAAQAKADLVIVSIFVNPTQFAPNEDFDAYPRDNDSDIAKLSELGVDAVFLPTVGEMYPKGFATGVSVGGPSQGLESVTRPHFFNGVALVVTKLLLAALPDLAIFGEKDYQQLCVIRQFVRDLNIPIEIEGAPTVREDDGLAMSSRNRYLGPDDRKRAALLPAVLRETLQALDAGTPVADALDRGRSRLTDGGFEVDYLELRTADTLAPFDDATRELRLLVAAKLGATRLIDNIPWSRAS
ncbi:pantoate--beta-alanine ligase [Stappia stellulata]|uniref:pantoate--beta-alanine ligase n=1 Tax=Stappia stellulata TaxID=71235 RepID=UPI001CD79B4F|nr:pantoate--beta-alanine ligase [Stappia stellulata]MCA1241400.1 pantoate--beta-alanine ligase [Stappia stellulata]